MSRPGVVALLLVVLTSCLPSFAVPHNVILITIDTTRADRMGFLGSPRGLTPHLDALAQQSVVFTQAYAQAPVTTASHATILTGTLPQFHKVNDAGVPLAADVPFAPAIFHAHGYQTSAFVGAVILDPKAGGAPGFDRGFDTYDAGFRERGPRESRYDTLERRGADVVAHANVWLAKHDKRPFFVWIHLYDPHAPYDPPEPFRSRYPDPYDGEIAYADSVVGTLLDDLRTSKLYDGSVIAVMADHGEAFGEHGERGHGIFLYSPTIHVPLLVRLPSGTAAGKHVDSRVSLVDVLPTLLEAVNIPPSSAIQGKSLLPMIREQGTAANRTSYAETDYPHRAFGWSPLRALRSDKYLFVDAPRKELYDESRDPDNDHDLSSSASAVSSTLSSQLSQFRSRTRSSRTAPQTSLNASQEQKLRALGYVASSGGPVARDSEVGGIDPKDKISLANEMTDANLALEEGRTQEAILRLRGVVAQDSNFAPAYSVLGAALTQVGDFLGAIPILKRAIELRPDSVSSRYSLGMALFQVGDFYAAAPQFEAAVKGSPGSADMHYSLASVYVRINRMADARKELEKALALRPNHFPANVMLGQVFLVQKSPAMALPYLKKAEKLQPNAGQVHQLLADAYTQLGDKSNAEQERALAQQR